MSGTLAPISGVPNVTGIGWSLLPDPCWWPFLGLALFLLVAVLVGLLLSLAALTH